LNGLAAVINNALPYQIRSLKLRNGTFADLVFNRRQDLGSHEIGRDE
jgi:hypothetical protein